jgi:hypothetical protein
MTVMSHLMEIKYARKIRKILDRFQSILKVQGVDDVDEDGNF